MAANVYTMRSFRANMKKVFEESVEGGVCIRRKGRIYRLELCTQAKDSDKIKGEWDEEG